MKKEILAAGGIVMDNSSGVRRVLLVHRPRYDDWSFPKGKLDPGETVEEAALREVKEETGLDCLIVSHLTSSRYNYRTRHRGALRPKVVHYFLMKRVGGRIRVLGEEVDKAGWFALDEAAGLLSYPQDRMLLRSLSEPRTIA